jgi:hypothetical protein
VHQKAIPLKEGKWEQNTKNFPKMSLSGTLFILRAYVCKDFSDGGLG